MNQLKLYLITMAIVVGEALVLAGYVVDRTGSAEGITAVGQMIAQIVAAFMGCS